MLTLYNTDLKNVSAGSGIDVFGRAAHIAAMGKAYPTAERQRVIAHVCLELAKGRAVGTILRDDADMCGEDTWYRWLLADEILQEQVDRARQYGIEVHLANAQAIADGDDIGSLEGLTGDALYRAMSRQDVRRAKLRIETAIKIAQMLKPKKYGPKLDLTSDGKALGDGRKIDTADKAAELLRTVENRLVDPKAIDLLS